MKHFKFLGQGVFRFESSEKMTLVRRWRMVFTQQSIRYELVLQARFCSDGASIPRYLWSVMGAPFVGKYRKSAIAHDALYATQITSRAFADLLFLTAMKHEGCSWFSRYTMYIAVRFFGFLSWRKTSFQSMIKMREKVQINRLES